MIFNNRYQFVSNLGEKTSYQSFLALDISQSSSDYCVLQKSRLKDTKQILAYIKKLKKIALNPQIPNFLDSFLENDHYYLVFAYISGENLESIRTDEGVFTVSQICQLLSDILPLLEFIHNEGLIHRDLKPVNLIYRTAAKQKQLILVDWAIATLINETTPILGNPQYAAPEQLKGQPVYASDLYSLGMICLNLQTGLEPFALLDVINHEGWAFLELPESPLNQIIQQLIEPSMQRRFISAKAVMQSMEQLRMMPKSHYQQKPFLQEWQCMGNLKGHSGLFATINTVAISPDNQLIASGSDDQTIRLWDIASQKEIAVLSGHSGFVKSVVFSASQTLLVSGSADKTIKIWDWQKQELVCTLSGHQQAVNTAVFSADGGKIISGSADKTIKIWDWQKEEAIATLTGHNLAVTGVVASDTVLASVSVDRTLRIWQNGQSVSLTGHNWGIKAIALSPDSHFLATGGDDNTIIIWDVLSKKEIRKIAGHSWSVASLCFSLDGQWLISASWDKKIKIWQVETGKQLALLEGHSDSVYAVAIDNLGKLIVSGSKDKTLKLWQLAIS